MSGNPKLGGPKPRRGQGFWLTAGEVVGVLALIVAGLNYWDNHQQRVDELKRERAQSAAAVAFVAAGEVTDGGRQVILRPLAGTQAIQSERYEFPKDLAGQPIEITAERPHLEASWIAAGVKHAIVGVHGKESGSLLVPVLIRTEYVESGEGRSDLSLYNLSVGWKRTFLGGPAVRLKGIALVARGLAGDGRGRLEQSWVASRPAAGP